MALPAEVRLAVLGLLDYPSLFKEAAQRKGLVLPSIETLSRMEAAELATIWELALQAEASLEAGLQSLAQPGGAPGALAALVGAAQLADPAAAAAAVAAAAASASLAAAGALGDVEGEVLPPEVLADLQNGDLDAEDVDFLRQALSSTRLPAQLRGDFRSHEHYERGFPFLLPPSQGGVHTCLMAKHLTPELYDELKEGRTATGFTLDDAIRPGVRLPTHEIGLLAGDSECYEIFPSLFDIVVHDWHGWHRSQSASHKADTDASKLEIPSHWADAAAVCLSAIRIDVRRNFVGWMFTPSLNVTGRGGVERAGQALFEQLGEDQHGEYYPLAELDTSTRELLRTEGILFEAPDLVTLQAGAGAAPYTSELSEWEEHRGIFRSSSGKLAVMINQEDHLRIIVRQEDSDIIGAFASLCSALTALDRSHASTAGIAASPRRGALTVSPANLGTGMRICLTLRLPHLGKDATALEAVCSQLLRQAANTAALVSPAADQRGTPGHFWEVSTKASVGVSEVMLIQGAIYLTIKLAELEERLASGQTLLQAMTPPPPGDAAPIQLAAAARTSASLQTLQTLHLSGRPLNVRDWAGGSERLAVTGLLPSQDALLLAQLLYHHTSLRSLDASHCRLTSSISHDLVHALGASLMATRPPLLTDLRLAGNRLRTSGALALVDALVDSRCPLATLDLSGTELCGGTISLPRIFGELRASTARVGDEGHSATLTSDGLCSVGPLMERGSGSYHAELLVKQATDADGAYVGIVTPLAKLSSYPGADAHSVGWRAKGGLRHKHGSTVEAASLAWGQGDRVGLRLDTDQCSLTLYKNGEVLTTNQLLPVSFAEAGARFCVGRYYGTVEMYCVSMSRIGGSLSIDFTALAALCTRIIPLGALRTLRLSGNQLAGVDSVGGGERTEEGVRELLSVLQSGQCSLDELDLSSNMLSQEDAQALLRAAMAGNGTSSTGSKCAVRQLQINQWKVPVELRTLTPALTPILTPALTPPLTPTLTPPLAPPLAPTGTPPLTLTWKVPVELLARGGATDLALSRQDIGSADAMLLAATISAQVALQPVRLDLSANALGADGALAVVRSIAERGIALRELRLANTGIRSLGVAMLLTELQRVPSLEVLDLSSNALTVKDGTRESSGGGGGGIETVEAADHAGRTPATEALEALCTFMATEGLALRVLRLANCGLCSPSDQGSEKSSLSRPDLRGMGTIVAAVRSCRCNLRELGLGANRIRDGEATLLLSAVADHANLRLKIGLECNALSAECLATLRRQLPDGCSITGRFQQPRCGHVNDLSKASGEHGRVAAIVPLAFSAGGPLSNKAAFSSKYGDVAIFLASSGGDYLRMGMSLADEVRRFEAHDDDITCVDFASTSAEPEPEPEPKLHPPHPHSGAPLRRARR